MLYIEQKLSIQQFKKSQGRERGRETQEKRGGEGEREMRRREVGGEGKVWGWGGGLA